MGIGGGPEGILAASALDSFNCFFKEDLSLIKTKIRKELMTWELKI